MKYLHQWQLSLWVALVSGTVRSASGPQVVFCFCSSRSSRVVGGLRAVPDLVPLLGTSCGSCWHGVKTRPQGVCPLLSPPLSCGHPHAFVGLECHPPQAFPSRGALTSLRTHPPLHTAPPPLTPVPCHCAVSLSLAVCTARSSQGHRCPCLSQRLPGCGCHHSEISWLRRVNSPAGSCLISAFPR